jgi:hypothetical protein
MHAFREFADRRANSLSILSALFAARLEIQAGQWSNSFNLVVGDAFEDRILFWNARLLIPTWLDGDLCCLRVTMDQLEDPEFLAIVRDLLKHRNRVNYGSGGPSLLTIRSASLNAAGLAKAVGLIGSTSGSIASEVVVGLDAMVPPTDALQQARQNSRSSGELYPKRLGWLHMVSTNCSASGNSARSP